MAGRRPVGVTGSSTVVPARPRFADHHRASPRLVSAPSRPRSSTDSSWPRADTTVLTTASTSRWSGGAISSSATNPAHATACTAMGMSSRGSSSVARRSRSMGSPFDRDRASVRPRRSSCRRLADTTVAFDRQVRAVTDRRRPACAKSLLSDVASGGGDPWCASVRCAACCPRPAPREPAEPTSSTSLGGAGTAGRRRRRPPPWALQGSNLRPRACKARALAT